jgi:DNA-binding IclR family transcriptional regulator
MKQIDRTLDLLELLGERGELSLAEAAALLGASRPTAYRLLTKLQSRAYVDHLPQDHRYRLGPAIRSLVSQFDLSTISRLAGPAMADLRASTGETVNLAVVRRGHIIYSAILDGHYALRMSASVGQDVPPHATALGKAILSAMSPDERHLLLGPPPYRRFAPNTLVKPSALDQDLAITRSRGYAIDREEVDVGAVCIAAPILGSEGTPVAAISVSAVAARFPEQDWSVVGKAVKQWGDRISAELGQVETVEEAEC